MIDKVYDLIVVGGGASGMICAITASRDNRSVLLLEKLPHIGAKLKVSGGGRCNLSNTLKKTDFMEKFGKDGRFMQDALDEFDSQKLIDFLSEIGVEVDIADGFRIFPTSRSSQTIIDAFVTKLNDSGVEILTNQRVERLLSTNSHIDGVKTSNAIYRAKNVVIATGGLGYSELGSDGDGYNLAVELGHKITPLYPAMMPLHTKERWVAHCRADTLAKVEMGILLKKYKKLKAFGDLIFTKKGIRGPVVLDFAREITPLLEKYGEVPIYIKMLPNKNEEQILKYFKNNPQDSVGDIAASLLNRSIADELCKLAGVDSLKTYKKSSPSARAKLISLIHQLPLSVIGHDGFDKAMVTRGGVSLKEIDPKTMQSKLILGLYFCGEVVNLDGPCGGFNLQWSFSSGYLAGKLL